ncbi:hypothetical protein BDBG_09218 [Blastomyces gilchristii SLH14081]|uniref:Uncharacterized protein n=1 Tax=Blastomyces gilchristii (strain SLH14081) TaxID=559298 RepID=A0A179V1E4_BLAGS|nr:uncharacterized protein BDBG_09218 [Blastomyces gilchristii SLH14081]OAT14135.1 hypothetical protein BDBG_09218 [Blastomyces gilchristii SLH14081]
MPVIRRLLREEITYSSANEKEVNILHRLSYPSQESQFFALLHRRCNWVRAIIAHHLNLESPDECDVDVENWLHGSYNKGKKRPGDRVMLRLPLPYHVGEAFRLGNADERVRCEAGTYAWLEDNCPDIPIPRLYDFVQCLQAKLYGNVQP